MHISAAAMLSFFTLSGTAVLGTDVLAQNDPAATAGAIQIAQPYNKAVVRESVPIKVREFPQGGYVSVSIDGKFITAQALPKAQNLPVYVWDTKATYTDPDNPDTPKTYNDGVHAITVVIYNSQNKQVGEDSVSVQLADKINLPASQGIKLVYPWKTGMSLRYQRRTTLTATPTDSTSTTPTAQVLQQSLLRFGRTVENVSGGTSLVRDSIIAVDHSARPKAFVSYVATHGQSQALSDGIHAKYREVDARGRVLSVLAAQNASDSIGFSIPVLPPRRVSVGAHWESPVQMTLDWTSPYPATVQATSTLVDFEWQDRYPTAKIRETYAGPATFYPGPGSALPAIQSHDIKFERIIYFAYNAGRVVRTQTTVTLTSTDPGLLNASPGPAGFGGGGFPGGFGGRGNMGRPRGGYPGGPPPGAFGGGYPGGPPPGAFGNPGGDDTGGPPAGAFGGGYPGGPPPGAFGGYPGGQGPGGMGGYPGAGGPNAPAGSPVKLTYSETAVLLI